MMAVLLSAVLATGTVWNAAPMTALAQEAGGPQESAGGSMEEPAEGGTKPVEGIETAPAEGTGSGGQEQPDSGQESPGAGTEEGSGQEPGAGAEEGGGQEPGAGAGEGSGQEPGAGTEEGSGQEPGAGAEEGSGQETPGTGTAGEQETVSGNDPGVDGSGTGDGSSEDAEEETQDTVSGNDMDSVSGNDIELPVRKANRKARMLAQSLSGEITSDTTWTDGSTVSDVEVIGGASEQDAVVITVEGSVTVTGTITVSSGHVRFTGGGSLNWQAASISNAVTVEAGANAIFENVTLDGSNVDEFGGSALLFQGTVTLESGVKVQNYVSYTGRGPAAGYKGVIAVWGAGSLMVTDGVTVTGCRSTSGIIAIYQTDDGGGESTASVVMSGGEIKGNTVDNSNLGVIWNWCGKLNISGGTVTAEGNEYAVHTQGNAGKYDATTVISGGTFIGNTLGAVCAGKDSSNNSRITIAGGSFAGKTAATVNYGEINIDGGRFTGSDYALKTVNTGAALNVAGGEFYGGTKAYSGNVTTKTDKVIVGTNKESAANWDKTTNLNTYQYVAIGEIPEHPGDNWKRDVNFKIKIYGYCEDYSLNFENVGVIWEENINNPVIGEVLAQEEVKDGYYLWEYVFKGLDTGRRYDIKNGNTPGRIGEISETGTAFERTFYAVNYYDGDTLAQVMYTESGKTVGRAWQPPVKDGYTFAGWMTEKDGSEAFDFEGAQITRVTNVYASWTPDTPTDREWTLDDGKLTILTDAGMTDWVKNHKSTTKDQVTSVVLEEGVTGIPDQAFKDCTGLTTVSIPGSVTGIGDHAFDECYSLMSVTLLGDEPPEIGIYVFGNGGELTFCGFVTADKQGIHVPEGKADIYKEKWSDWADYIVGDVRHHTHDGSTFTPWTESDCLPDKEGNYYLTKDVTLHGAWSVPGPLTGLCLNGKTIRQADENENVLCIAGSSLALYDCVDNGKITGGVYGIENNYVCYMYGGEITGNCVGVKNKYLFEMRGGKISGNTITAESGIQDDAAGVCNEKNFTMLGGEISGNQGRNGGGLDTHHDETDYYYLKIGGNAVITGNTDADGNANNCLLRDSRQITIAGFTDDAQIGITTEAVPTAGSPVNITHSNSIDYSSFFTSDNPDYAIEDSGDGHIVQLAVPHVHEYGDTWETDGTSHWHECACGAKSGEAAHTEDDGTVTVQPTENTEGTKVYKCSVCERELRTETIPATGGGDQPGDKGEVSTDVEKGDNAPALSIATAADELADIVLTDAEKEQVRNGTDVRIILEVKDKTDSVDDVSKSCVEQALDGYTVGQYLDISLFKEIGDVRKQVGGLLRDSITITINVPDGLKNKDSKKTRTFAVIRVHDGQANRLEDQDKNDNTITIATNCFSTYTLVYKDTVNGGGGNSGGNNGGSSGGSGNTGGDDSGNTGGSGDDSNGGNSGGNGNNGGSNEGSNSTGGSDGGSNTAGSSKADAAGRNGSTVDKAGEKTGQSKDSEPRTEDNTPVELYATLSMVAGLAYLLLYFTDRRHGMTEETKKELVAKLVGWAKRGGRIRRLLALAAIFVLLVYYHSIGKKTCVEWKEVYGE